MDSPPVPDSLPLAAHAWVEEDKARRFVIAVFHIQTARDLFYFQYRLGSKAEAIVMHFHWKEMQWNRARQMRYLDKVRRRQLRAAGRFGRVQRRAERK